MKDFTRGMIVYACVQSLYQDIVYKTAEGFAEHILNGGWTDRSITIPVAIIILILVYASKQESEK